MTRRPALARFVVLALSAILGLAGPGSALAHGVAHVREHEVAEHHDAGARDRPHAVERVPAHGHEHDADAPDADHEQRGTHEHPRLDAPALTRIATSAFLPAVPVVVPSAPVIAATVPAPPAATPLRLAEPPTGPPPPSRSPPLG